MKYRCFVLWFCVMVFQDVVCQVVLNTEHDVAGFANIPQERVYVHSNASFLLTGEYLYYKVYNLNTEDGGLSQMSKMAYVELIGQEGTPVFKHKILLENGLGHGDFFISTDVSSGVYKLVAYTRWMQNNGLQSYYQKDVTIVNPYRSNQPQLQTASPVVKDSIGNLQKDSLGYVAKTTALDTNIGSLKLGLKGSNFGKRTKVSFTIIGNTDTERMGNYSISIRKKDWGTHKTVPNIAGFIRKKAWDIDTAFRVGDTVALPELRGEIFTGTVVALAENISVKNLKVGISIPGEDAVLEVVQTDDNGNFLVNIGKSYETEQMFLQVLAQDPGAYRVRMNEPKRVDASKMDFAALDVGVALRDEIIRRSIHTQIENSYFQFRPDSLVTKPSEGFLDNKVGRVYALDDYTRFRTVRETLLEIVQDVSSKKIAKDDYAVRVKGYDYTSLDDVPPLVLLDGLLLQDHNSLLEFDARKVERIMVYRQKFIYGAERYEGAIVFSSKKGDGYRSFTDEVGVTTATIPKPRPVKNYFVQRYDKQNAEASSSRLPDDRIQLLWMPGVQLTEKNAKIDFFTSDVTGEFEIVVEGITTNRQPISLKSSFRVGD